MARRDATVNEKALLFGETKSLVGIVTDPPTGTATNGRPGVVILNAGIVHHVGPNRIHVKAARRLGANGFVVMRFDYSGIGDSLPRADGLPFVHSTLRETRQCLDYLQSSRDLNKFILMGICSGADNALRTACNDERVAGVVLIEGHAVPTLGFLLQSYRAQLLHPRSWWRLLTGKSEAWIEIFRVASKHRSVGTTRVRGESMVPTRKSLIASIWKLAERDASMLLVYSEASPSHYFYETCVRKKIQPLRIDGRVREHFISGSDHIFTHPKTQADLFEAVFNWIGERK